MRPASPINAGGTAGSPGSTCGARVISTENDALAWLPLASVAVQVTGVVPMGNTLPLAGAHATAAAGSTMSVAVGIGYVNVAPPGSFVVIDGSAGMPTSVGAVVSTTVMWNEPLVVSPPESVAEQPMVVVPSGSTAPGAGLQTGTGAVASLASVAETV